MIKYLFLLSFIVFPALIFSQSDADITIIMLIRHAEKEADGTKDPPLTPEGRERATRLAYLLKNAEIDAIYTSPYQRTRETVAPLAKEKNITIKEYNPSVVGFIAKIVSENKGGTVVVSGHSNTTPAALNQLLGQEQYAMLNESEYGKIFIVSVSGEGQAKVVELYY